MKLATTTADFKDYTAKDDLPQAIRLLAECGFRHIDVSLDGAYFEGSKMLSDEWEKWVGDIKRTGDELGVDFVQAHAINSSYNQGADRDYRMDMLRRQLRICQMLGIPGMVVHGICKANGEREDFMEKNAEMYGELLPTAEETGVRIYTENTCRQNCPTYYLYDGADLNELRSRLGNHPLFGFCWDVGHANCHGVDQYKCIKDMGDGLMAVHIHDNDGCRDLHLQPYSGGTCYDAIVKGLLDINFKGPFTLEALSLPVAPTFCFCNRKHFTEKGDACDRLWLPPLEFKMRGEKLMYDMARWMLESYGCLEE